MAELVAEFSPHLRLLTALYGALSLVFFWPLLLSFLTSLSDI